MGIKGMDRTTLKNYVKYMDEGLKMMKRVPFKNPKTAITIAALAAAVDVLRKALEDSGVPGLILMEGGKTDAN